MRKLIKKTIFLLIASFLTLNSTFAFYSDVPTSHEHYTAIKALYDSSLLAETPDNQFYPDELITIIDLYEILLSYGQVDLETSTNLPYSNSDELNAHQSSIIQTALNLNILSAKGLSPTLNTTQTLSKYYALTVLFESLGIGTNHFFETENFIYKDLNPLSESAPLAFKALEIGILEDDPYYFKMTKRITRAELANYLYLLRDYSPASTTIVEVDADDLSYEYMLNSTQKDLLESSEFQIFLDIWSKIQKEYLYQEELNDSDLIAGAITGLVDQLEDLYTTYQLPEDADNFLDSLSSEYEGIGMSVDMIDDQVIVVSPFKNSPAEAAGLKPNDIIIKVDDEDVLGQTLEEVVNKIKGPADTKVEITILRNEKELNFTVTRDFILYNSIESEMLEQGNKDIAYIEIISFNDTTSEEFTEAATALIEENPDGFIIDLRNNPGGYMYEAILITDLFSDEILTVVTLEFADGAQENFETFGNGLLKDYEVVILINGGSASASEILAGALQDHGLAKIIGTTSFGKGSVQQLAQYFDDSLFKYTIARWLTPNGTDISKKGITPDKTVENPGTEDKQLEEALGEF